MPTARRRPCAGQSESESADDTLLQYARAARCTDSGEESGHASHRVDAFGVDLYGQFDLITGLGESSRGYARALQTFDVPVHLVSLSSMYPRLATVDSGLTSDPRGFPLVIEHVNVNSNSTGARSPARRPPM